MEDIVSCFMTFIVVLVVCFLLFMDREMYPAEIEAAYEVCESANSKMKRMAATHGYNTVYCESGAVFKLPSAPYMEEKE